MKVRYVFTREVPYFFFCVIICYYGSVNIGCKECGIEWWMLEEIKYLHSQSLTVDLKSC